MLGENARARRVEGTTAPRIAGMVWDGKGLEWIRWIEIYGEGMRSIAKHGMDKESIATVGVRADRGIA